MGLRAARRALNRTRCLSVVPARTDFICSVSRSGPDRQVLGDVLPFPEPSSYDFFASGGDCPAPEHSWSATPSAAWRGPRITKTVTARPPRQAKEDMSNLRKPDITKLALLRFVWARGQVPLVYPGPRSGLTAEMETLLDAGRRRTPCGQSVDVARDRGDKLGTTRLIFLVLARSVRRVAASLSPLIHPLPTLRRATSAAGPGRLRRNNNWFCDCSYGNGMVPYPHQT